MWLGLREISKYSTSKQFVGTGIFFLLFFVVGGGGGGICLFVCFLSFYKENLGKILREDNDRMKVVALC